MIKFNCNVKIKHNYKNIQSIINKLPMAVSESIEDVLKNIQGYAIRLEKGHNEEGILIEQIDMSTKQVKSRIYADPSKFVGENGESYLYFEYFGTGTFAELEHVGKTAHFIESEFTEWYIPVNKVGRILGFPIITIKGEQFYVAHGMKANHFLSDAEFQSRNENADIIKKKIDEMIRSVCK